MLWFRQVMLTTLLAGFLINPVAAQSLRFEGAWSPEAPPVAPVMAGYVRISNPGNEDRTITTSACPDFDKVEIHDMQHHNGMMRMIKQEQLIIPAGETVALQPGGMHLMLMKPQRPIKAGETLDITFTLSDGETIRVPFSVKPQSARDQQTAPARQHHHH